MKPLRKIKQIPTAFFECPKCHREICDVSDLRSELYSGFDCGCSHWVLKHDDIQQVNWEAEPLKNITRISNL